MSHLVSAQTWHVLISHCPWCQPWWVGSCSVLGTGGKGEASCLCSHSLHPAKYYSSMKLEFLDTKWAIVGRFKERSFGYQPAVTGRGWPRISGTRNTQFSYGLLISCRAQSHWLGFPGTGPGWVRTCHGDDKCVFKTQALKVLWFNSIANCLGCRGPELHLARAMGNVHPCV